MSYRLTSFVQSYKVDHLISYRLAESMCCKKEAHPDLCYDATDTSEKVHMHTPLRCTHGTDHTGKVKCDACGIENRLRRLLRNMKRTLSP